MNSNSLRVSDVDTYIASFPGKTQKVLQELRATITQAAPEAQEVISYQIPAYTFHGMLVYFGGYAHHIGFYPTPSAIEHFRDELAAFKTSKGAVQFPLDKPLPLKLISKIVTFKAAENLQAAQLKRKVSSDKRSSSARKPGIKGQIGNVR